MTILVIIGLLLLLALVTWIFAGAPGVGKHRPRPDMIDRMRGTPPPFDYSDHDPRR